MDFYSSYDLMPADSGVYEPGADDEFPLDLTELCDASLSEDMQPLNAEVIKSHALNMVILGTYQTPRGLCHRKVLTYAGITGFEKIGDKKLAVVGGVITHPEARKLGLGFLTANGLLRTISLHSNLLRYRHEGFVAKCNDMSAPLFAKLGFIASGEEGGVLVMTSYLDARSTEWVNGQKRKQAGNN